MEKQRPLVLITNDDSIHAAGVDVLADIAKEFADVIVVAPSQPQSGMSSAISVGKPLRINAVSSDDDENAVVRRYSVSGTPVDCVKLALNAIVPRRPDFLFSGINHGSNSGSAITYSGTMGAVLEGCIVGIPSVGFSLLHHSLKADFTLSRPMVRAIMARVMAEGLPSGLCLNVNIPAKVVPIGVKVCRSAHGHWSEEYCRYIDPVGSPFYWLTGRFVNEEPQATDTDEYWLGQNFISIVPVSPDQTLFKAMPQVSRMFSDMTF